MNEVSKGYFQEESVQISEWSSSATFLLPKGYFCLFSGFQLHLIEVKLMNK